MAGRAAGGAPLRAYAHACTLASSSSVKLAFADGDEASADGEQQLLLLSTGSALLGARLPPPAVQIS